MLVKVKKGTFSMAMIFLFPALFCKEKDLRSGIRMEDTGRNT